MPKCYKESMEIVHNKARERKVYVAESIAYYLFYDSDLDVWMYRVAMFKSTRKEGLVGDDGFL